MNLPSLAIPSFVSGPLDSLITADVYSASPVAVVNAIKPITANSSLLSASGILGGSSMASSLKAVLSTPAAGLASSVASSLVSSVLKSLPTNSLGGSLNLGGLSSAVTNNLLSGISLPSIVTVAVGGVVSKVANSLLSDVMGVGNLINTFSCNNGGFYLNNLSNQGTVAASLINQANALGIKGSFGSVSCGITDQSTLNKLVGSTLSGAVQSGDLSSIAAMATSASSGTLTALQPNVLSSLSANFTPNPGDSVQTSYNSIMSTYNTVDPTWTTTTRATTAGADNAIDLTAIQGGNSDFQACFATGSMNATDPTSQALILGTVIPPTDVNSSLSTMYPSTVLGQSPNAATTSVDPSTVTVSQTTTVNNNVTTVDTTTTVGGGSVTTYTPPSNLPPQTGAITYDPPIVSTDYLLQKDGTTATAVITVVNASDGSATMTTVWTYPPGTLYPQGKTVTQTKKVDPQGEVTTDVNTTTP